MKEAVYINTDTTSVGTVPMVWRLLLLGVLFAKSPPNRV